MLLLNLLKQRRRVNQLRSNTKLFFTRVLPLTVLLSGILGIYTTLAETVTITDPVQVTGIVYEKTIPVAPPPQPNPISNNGIPLPQALSGTDSASFSGYAYPGAMISIMKNGLLVHESPAGQDGRFTIPVRNIVPGTYTFTLLAKDVSGIKSSQVTYTIIIAGGIVTEVNGIIMPPTITTDKTEVKVGDPIIFSGASIPNKDLTLTVFARSGLTRTITANASGTWTYALETSTFDTGDYNAKVRTKVGLESTLYSESVLFTMGNKNTLRKKGSLSLINARCDLNNDSRVNLLDFSIMAFWYKRLGFPAKVDLNSDNRINLTDLSILAYCWTG